MHGACSENVTGRRAVAQLSMPPGLRPGTGRHATVSLSRTCLSVVALAERRPSCCGRQCPTSGFSARRAKQSARARLYGAAYWIRAMTFSMADLTRRDQPCGRGIPRACLCLDISPPGLLRRTITAYTEGHYGPSDVARESLDQDTAWLGRLAFCPSKARSAGNNARQTRCTRSQHALRIYSGWMRAGPVSQSARASNISGASTLPNDKSFVNGTFGVHARDKVPPSVALA